MNKLPDLVLSRASFSAVRLEVGVLLVFIAAAALRALWIYYRHPPTPRPEGLDKVGGVWSG